MKAPFKVTTLNVLLLAAASCLIQPLLAGEPISETRDMDADGVVNIELTNGEIIISGWDQPRFSVEGELSDKAEGFTLRDGNGNIRFEEHMEPRNRWNWGDGWRGNDESAARLTFRVPYASVLRFDGTNTNVDVAGLTGNTHVEVVNGEIIANGLSGVVRLETVNGAIKSEGLNGRITLETVNGSIDDLDSTGSRVSYSAVNGSINSNTRSTQVGASNVNGSIELDLDRIDDLEVSTVGGTVDVFAIMNEQAQVEMSSVGGSIDLSLPQSTSASFHLSTAVGGRIRNELSDDEPEKANRYVNSRNLDFVLNGGNGDVNISTVSGNIRLRSCSADAC